MAGAVPSPRWRSPWFFACEMAGESGVNARLAPGPTPPFPGICCRDTSRPGCLHLSDELLLLLASIKHQKENTQAGGAKEADLYVSEQEGSPWAAADIGAAPVGNREPRSFPMGGAAVHVAREMLGVG